MKWSLAAVDKFIISTFAMVVLLAQPTYSSLMDSNSVPQNLTKSVSSVSQTQRGIASVSKSLEVKGFQESFESSFDLRCAKNVQDVQMQVRGDYIQLHGHNCWKNKAADAIEIENTTNGYSASVFQQASAKYKTDLIQLQPGLNQLKIRFRAVTGQLTEQTVSVLSN